MNFEVCKKKHHISKCKICWMEKRYKVFKQHPSKNLSDFKISDLEEIRYLLMRSRWFTNFYLKTIIKKYKNCCEMKRKVIEVLNKSMYFNIKASIWLAVNCEPFLFPFQIHELENMKDLEKWLSDCKEFARKYTKYLEKRTRCHRCNIKFHIGIGFTECEECEKVYCGDCSVLVFTDNEFSDDDCEDQQEPICINCL